MAAAAGAELADLEFCQFHPTALALPGTRFDGLLITEAVRGEGATLLDAAGPPLHRRARAPRRGHRGDPRPDRGRRRRAASRSTCASIDPARFPNVFESLRRGRPRPGAEPVPVAPAAHYMMGGIAVDLDGRSSLPGLFAVGECSCTGLHGANRLASNSLSECFVFGGRAAARGAARRPPATQPPDARPIGASSRRPRPPATPSGASPGRCARPSCCASCSPTPTRWPPRSPPARWSASESRGGHLRADFPQPRPGARRHPHRRRPRRRDPPRDLALSARARLASARAARSRRRRDLHRRRPVRRRAAPHGEGADHPRGPVARR